MKVYIVTRYSTIEINKDEILDVFAERSTAEFYINNCKEEDKGNDLYKFGNHYEISEFDVN